MPTTVLDIPAMVCLAIVFSLLPLAQVLASFLIRKSQSPSAPNKGQGRQHSKDYYLLLWHIFDALTHFLIEGSYLYNCFFTSVRSDSIDSAPYSPRSKPFLNDTTRLYGAKYGTGATARLWQEYGKADRRWVESDAAIDVIALEVFTVFVVGAAALTVCFLLVRSRCAQAGQQQAKYRRNRARMWMVAMAVAVAEIYGGWMTFVPEWLSGSRALQTESPVYLWLYLVFFNGIWLAVPVWVLRQAWNEVQDAYVGGASDERGPTGAAGPAEAAKRKNA